MTHGEESQDILEELRIRFEIGEISKEEYERLTGKKAITEKPIIEVKPTIPAEPQVTKQQLKSKKIQIFEKIIITAIGIMGLFFLSTLLNLPNLGYELVGPALILLASQIIPIIVERKGINVVAYILKGVSFARFVYILFITMGTRIFFLFQVGYLGNLLVLIVFGVMIHGLGKEMTVWARFNRFQPIFSGVGVIIVGLALWEMMKTIYMAIHLTMATIPFVNIGSMFLMGFLAVTIALFSSYGRYLKEPVIMEISNWLAESQLRNFLIGSFFGFYFFLLRPIIVQAFFFAPIIEWSLVGLIMLRVYSGVKSKISEEYAPPLDIASWKRHVQKIGYRGDPDLEEIRYLQSLFVNEGVRDPILVFLTVLLAKNDYPQKGIAYLLHPLINYEDKGVPLIAFDWEKKRILKKNREARMKIMNAVMKDIKEGLAPIYLKGLEAER